MKLQEVNFKNHRNCLPLGLGVRLRLRNPPVRRLRLRNPPVRRLRNPPLKLNE